jgi:hypothetical protein
MDHIAYFQQRYVHYRDADEGTFRAAQLAQSDTLLWRIGNLDIDEDLKEVLLTIVRLTLPSP